MVTPVWIDHDGDLILINIAIGRIKQKQTTKGEHVSVAIADQSNMYERRNSRTSSRPDRGAGGRPHRQLANKHTGAKKYERSSPQNNESSSK